MASTLPSLNRLRFRTNHTVDGSVYGLYGKSQGVIVEPTCCWQFGNCRIMQRKGMFYISGRDAHYRPIIVIDSLKVLEAQMSEEECMETQTYFFEWVMRHCFIPGQVESWVALIDSAYQGFFSLVSSLQSSFQFLSRTYRMRLYTCFNVRINWPIRLVWNIVQKFLDEETVNKINFI